MGTQRHTGRFWWLVLLLVAVAAWGVSRLSLNADYRVYFAANDPLILLQQELSNQYQPLETLVVALKRESGLDDQGFLALAADLQERLYATPYVVQVQGLQDLPWPGDEQALLDAIAELEGRVSGRALGEYLGHPRADGLMLSLDTQVIALYLQFALPGENQAKEILEAMAGVRGLVEEYTQSLPVTPIISGTPALNEAYIQTVRHDLRWFIPAMLFIFLLLLWYYFRSFTVAGLQLLSALLPVVAAFGAAGWLGMELAAIHAFAPVIIVTICIAGSVHMMTAYSHHLAVGATPVDAMRTSVAFNLSPLTLTTITTALGFLGLTLSPSPPLKVMGYVIAIGVVFNYLVVLWVLPFWLPRVMKRSKGLRNFRINRFVDLYKQRKMTVIVVFLVVLIPAVLLIPTNRIDDNVFAYFPEDHSFRLANKELETSLSGVNMIQYSLEGGKDRAVFDVQYQSRLKQAVGWLREQPEVKKVVSVHDWLVWRSQREGQTEAALLESYQRLSRDEDAHQLGFASELAADFSASRVLVYLQAMSGSELLDFDGRFYDWQNQTQPRTEWRGGVGPSLIFAKLGIDNARSMFFSLAIALLVIALLCGLLMRSLRAAWVGLVCNAFPVLLVYAGWALLEGHISLGSAVVMGMIMGIIVDDSIYLLNKYAHHRKHGRSDAMQQSLLQVGPALVITTITLCVGLCIGLMSNFAPIVAMSGLSVAIIAAALITDLLLLPALMTLGNTRRGANP